MVKKKILFFTKYTKMGANSRNGTLKYERYLKMLVNKLKLNENIEFMGYRNDVPNILSLCNVLISPAINEAFVIRVPTLYFLLQ